MGHMEKKIRGDQGEGVLKPSARKSLDLAKQRGMMETGKKEEGRQIEFVVKYAQMVIEIYKPYGGIISNISIEGVKGFINKGAEYGGWLKLMGSEDLRRLTTLVKQKKILPHDFCPTDLQALALHQREHAQSVERGESRGKEPYNPWTQRVCGENGKPVERRVHLATESTPEKPILPGGGLSAEQEDFLRNTLSVPECRMKKLKNGDKFEKVLSTYQYGEYNKRFGQSSVHTNRDLDGESSHRDLDDKASYREKDTSARYKPLCDSDGDLIEIDYEGHDYWETRYRIAEPNDGRSPYSSEYNSRCIVETAMMLLQDQEIDLSEDYVAEALKGDEHPYNDEKIPGLFKKLKDKGAASYDQIIGEVSIDTLRQALQYGYAIGIWVNCPNRSLDHVLVVDAIDNDYVYIRDGWPSDPDDRRYCVTIKDFENARPYRAIVPSKYSKDNSNRGYGSYSGSSSSSHIWGLPPYYNSYPTRGYPW